MLGGSHLVSAKMAQSGVRSNAPPLAMSAMTEDWTPPPRLMTVRVCVERISLPPRHGLPQAERRKESPSPARLACLWWRT